MRGHMNKIALARATPLELVGRAQVPSCARGGAHACVQAWLPPAAPSARPGDRGRYFRVGLRASNRTYSLDPTVKSTRKDGVHKGGRKDLAHYSVGSDLLAARERSHAQKGVTVIDACLAGGRDRAPDNR